jgi:hypothetical protein
VTTATQSQAKLLDPGLRSIYNDEAMLFPDEYPAYVNVSTMDEPYYTDYKMAFFGLIPEKPEGQSITYDDPLAGTTKRYDVTPYGLGYRVTKEMLRDDRYSQIKRATKHLARSVKQSVNILGASAYNNAFLDTPANFTGFNASESLCDTSHTLLGGGTYSNRPATDAALSVTALQAASIRMEKTVSERGFNTPIKATKLVIPVDLKYVAMEILKTPELPYTDQNTINAIKGEFGHSVWHFLTSSTAWFLIGSSHDINFFWRDKPAFSSGDDFDTGDSKHKVYLRLCESQFGDWRGIDGTDGTP